MWIHQSGDMYECSECGMIEHIKPLWTRCPVCGEPGELKGDAAVEAFLEEAKKSIHEFSEKLQKTLTFGDKALDPTYIPPSNANDVIEVVRCKNCIHRPEKPDGFTGDGYELDFPDSVCPCRAEEDEYYSWYPEDDWYCKGGERKEE